MEKLIVIGRVGAPHGVRGEVRVVPLTDFANRFDGLQKIFLAADSELEIERVKYNNQFVVLKFKGLEDRAAVEKLKGRLIQVRRGDASPLGAGEYYNFDIIGLAVYDEQGGHLGTVAEILRTGSNDVYVVQQEEQQLLIPALKKVVHSIDLQSGRMVVTLLEEME